MTRSTPQTALRVRVDGGERVIQSAAVLGRGSDADLQVDDARISRHHLKLEPGPEGWTITDLETANGTYMSGFRVGSMTVVGPLALSLGAEFDGVVLELEPAAAGWSPTIPAIAEAPAASGLPPLRIVFEGQSFVYASPEPLIVGREMGCYLRTDDARVSRHHARVEWSGNGWTVSDAGSANGTFAGGVQVSALAVTGPTTVMLGHPVSGLPLELHPAAS